MKKNYIREMLLLAVCCVTTSFVWAEPVGENEARWIASKYLTSPELRQPIAITRATETHEQPAYYLFTNTGSNKFVVVSGESRLNEVVGYGMMNPNADKPVSDEFKAILQRYERVVRAIREGKAQVPSIKLPNIREVKPLLTCQWEQNQPFNRYTPAPDGRNTPTGCVATATAQLMYYHKWPKSRPDSYIASQGTEAQRSSDYLWQYMKDKAKQMDNRGGDAVGVLMRDVGRAVHMHYYYKGSNSNLHYAMDALRNSFGYSVRHLYKDYMLSGTFHEVLLNELANGYPILVNGGSHVFVFDGYDRRGFIHINWGWGGEFDGYFDINTIYLPVSGFGLNDGKFYEDIEVVFAHPKDGKHKEFAAHRELETRDVRPFTITETEVKRGTMLHAQVRKLGTNSVVNGELGRFTGKVALGVYDEKGVRVRLFNSLQTELNLSSIFTTTTAEFDNLDFTGLPDGTYTLKPLSNELIERPSTYSGWQSITYANIQTVVLTSDRIVVKESAPRIHLSLEGQPDLLAPLYQDSGNQGVFGLLVRNEGWQEVRGKMIVRFQGIENAIEYTAPIIQDVLAQRLETTALRAPVLTSYSKNGDSYALLAGRYRVSFAISVPKGGNQFEEIPIATAAPIEVNVLPNAAPFYLNINGIDFLSDGKPTPLQVFNPKETKMLGLMAFASLRGRSNYYGPLFYRVQDITDGTSIEVGSVPHVSFIAFAHNAAKATLAQFPLNRLKSGHTYEVHVEIMQNGGRVDVWNNETPRVRFAVSDPVSTGVSAIKSTSRAPEVYNLQGIRISTPVDRLPKGIYIINGKKVIK